MEQCLVYEGIAYRQSQDNMAPWIVNFVIEAEELLQWAGIPRRLNEDMIGFQRVDDKQRVIKARNFFSTGINQSPTALVVGIHPAEEGEYKIVNLEFLEPDSDKPVRKCRLTVSLPFNFNETTNIDGLIDTLKRQIEYRISSQENNDLEDSEVDDQSDIDNTAEEESEESTPEEVELGMSKLQNLLEKLNNREWCMENLDELRDLAKPATIIDGQHRVKGAELCERNIPFTVCAVYDCAWSEQVFQFTVVNYTAKGIPDQFITANAALSLTSHELDQLQGRLVQAGVKVKEHELMQVVQWDKRSPFHEQVNLSEKKDPSKIGYKTMVSVAKTWYDGKESAIQNLLDSLYPDVKGKGAKSERLRRWKTDHWGLFFLDFWEIIHGQYKDTASNEHGYTLWSVGHSNLVKAVVLKELQSSFFTVLGYQMESFYATSGGANALEELRQRLREFAQQFVSWIPAGFFAVEWKTKGLDTGPGRVALQEAFRRLAEKKGAYQYTKSTLITGATD